MHSFNLNLMFQGSVQAKNHLWTQLPIKALQPTHTNAQQTSPQGPPWTSTHSGFPTLGHMMLLFWSLRLSKWFPFRTVVYQEHIYSM